MTIAFPSENHKLTDAEIAQIYRQRKAVFADRARRISAAGDLERDVYDRADAASYLLAKNRPDEPVFASFRLMLTMEHRRLSNLLNAAGRAPEPRGAPMREAGLHFGTAQSAFRSPPCQCSTVEIQHRLTTYGPSVSTDAHDPGAP